MNEVLPKYYFSGEYTDFYTTLLSLPHIEVSFRAGEFLWSTGEPITRVFYFRSGLAQTFVEHEEGHRKILSFHGAGTIFPGFQQTDFKIEKSIIVKALAEINAIAFERKAFYDLCISDSSLMARAFEMQAAYINMLIYDATHQKFNNTFRKLCNFLFLMSRHTMRDKPCGINITQENIADTLGVGRNHVTKYLSHLRQEGVVLLHRRYIEVIDYEKLAVYCSTETLPSTANSYKYTKPS
jgi:CRP-like cAMP-binding protein